MSTDAADAADAAPGQIKKLKMSVLKMNAKSRGGGLVVSVLAFYSDDPSSIPAEVYNFFCKNIVEKNENKQKEAGVGPFFKK